MKIIAWSDTHFYHQQVPLPDGDVLIHAGDFCKSGSLHEVAEFNDYLGLLPHRHKIVVAGNHDWAFENDPEAAQYLLTNAIYLQDQSIEIEGYRFYGSPWQPEFFSWAFNLQRGAEIRQKWDLIPSGLDVLITHGPPQGYCDEIFKGKRVGCEELLKAVQRVQPRYHVFGHIHEGYGQARCGKTLCINASICNHRYQALNPAQVFEI